MIKKPLKIALGDLKHNTIGRHSVCVPVGIGYIGAYTLSLFESGTIDLRLYTDPQEYIQDIDHWQPDIVGFANYCWNSALACFVGRYAKNQLPKVLCVMGGPEFPRDNEERKVYLTRRPEIDIYVYGDGEAAFYNILKGYLDNNWDIEKLKSHPPNGSIAIHPNSGEMIVGKPIPRFKNMDSIPSPYLNGLLDKWLTKDYVPSIETTRGCPFQCAYCHTGQDEEKNINSFSLQRIKDELNYIAERMKDLPNKQLEICDSNFGMYQRDQEIAKYIACLMDKYEWPMAFDVTTGKENFDRIFSIARLLRNRLPISVSPQSMNPSTLKAISRRNIPLDQYLGIVNEIKKLGQTHLCELIIPMPEESKETFFSGQKMLIERGVNTGITYTLMLLKGTSLAAKETRKRYQMQTKYRLLPLQFSRYDGSRVFEVEEVCIQTKTMPFEDYLDCRGFAFIAAVLTTEQFDIIHKHLHELDISFYDYVCEIWNIARTEKGFLSEIYHAYLEETKGELFDSEKDVREYYLKQENYEKLLRGEIGDNLMRKYKSKMILTDYVNLVELLYKTLRDMAGEKCNEEISESFNAAKEWDLAIRNANTIFENESSIKQLDILDIPYDVLAWYREAEKVKPLREYKRTTQYRIYHDAGRVQNIIREGKNLYGDDKFVLFGRALVYWKISDFWRKCEYSTIYS